MKTNNEIYTKEELEAVENIENGNYKALSKKDFEQEKNRFQKMAENTLKRKSINIRVFESDIDKIKALALSEGMPYQTFITSLLHKVATGKFKDYIAN
ncbi:MAG: putative DNA binding CopG/RHH family protein [Rickettsiales bacterium]|jgi:predicted DNA binding CopG/RHH family protein